MKTVGILTFHESPNYGALLQACALRKYVQSLGNQAVFIDYQNAERKYAQVHGLKKIRSVIWANTFDRILRSRKRIQRTKDFRAQYIPVSEHRYVTPELLQQNPPIYDAYITGSDQVWNKRNTNGDLSYFLDFVPEGKKRISYAPSFGAATMPDEYMRACKESILRIDHLSVREHSGADIIKNCSGRTAEVVCDPVFLLTRDEWEKIAKPTDNGKYIFCYYMPGDAVVEAKIQSVAEYLSRKTGYRVINAGKKVWDRLKVWESNIFDLGPAEFIGMIQNAEYVITNSFHGTAFSIVYGKKLVVPYNEALAPEKALNTRIIELLKIAGRSQNLISCNETLEDALLEKTEGTEFGEELRKLIEESKQFLRKALE